MAGQVPHVERGAGRGLAELDPRVVRHRDRRHVRRRVLSDRLGEDRRAAVGNARHSSSDHPGPTGGVVIGGDYQGLGIVRSLGRHGVPVYVIDDESAHRVGVYMDRGADSRLVLKIAERFDAALATGKYDGMFEKR